MLQVEETAQVRLLLVDDDLDILELVRDVLEGEGYQVTAASTAGMALQAADAQAALLNPPFDGFILDMRLPDASGADLLQELRRRTWGAATPALLTTASVEARPEGVTALLVKPFDLDDLTSAVRRFCKPTARVQVSH